MVDLNAKIIHFLNEILSFSTHEASDPNHVYVTLTFAQSLDAKIAGKDKEQLILSGKESMLMTHRLRSMHDAILVGIGTALNDDPQLNCRLLPVEEGDHHNPIPIVLDTYLRFSPEAKLLKNYRAGTGRRPLIATKNHPGDLVFHARRQELQSAGAEILCVPQKDGKLSISALLDELRTRKIRSLMVEGGAEVISSFLNSGHTDHLIVTIAPTIVGHEGVGYEVGQVPQTEFIRSQTIGRDTVMGWKVLRSQAHH